MKTKSGLHMHALVIKFEHADTIQQDWKLYSNTYS